MKIARLLVMSALWLVGLSVNAADVNERIEPTVDDVVAAPVEFEADHQYLLYNTGAAMYFSQGNAWGTRASGHAEQSQARRLYFTKYVPEGGEWDGKSYIFKIYSSVRSTNFSWHECFFDNEAAMFVDRGSQPNYLWEVKDMGNKTYRLMAADANAQMVGEGQTPIVSDGTLFVGWDPNVEQDYTNLNENYDNDNAYPLSPKTTENIEWVFYDAAIFAAYDASVELLAQIEAAEAEGIDVSAAVKVYNNLDATVAEINKATQDLKDARQANVGKATVDHPTDATSFIVNPDFVNNDLSTGWQGTGFGSYGPKENAEHYSKNYDTYQTITGLLDGVYAVGVNAFYRAGDSQTAYNNYKASNEASRYAKLYAVTGTDTLKSAIASPYTAGLIEMQGVGAEASATDSETGEVFYIPNNMEAAEYYMHELGFYKNKVMVGIDDQTLTIGVKKDMLIGSDWSIFDDFSLTYYGNTPEAFQFWIDEVKRNATDYSKSLATKTLVDAYNAVLANAKASNKAEAVAAMQEIAAAEEELAINCEKWAEWEAKVNEALEMAIDPDLQDYAYDLVDYAEVEAEQIKNAKNLDNDALQAEIDKIDEMILEAKEAAKNDVKPGDDVTKRYLVNADFEQGNTGWLGAESITAFNAGCAEAYEKNPFDLYQIVDGVKAGVYEISLKGFFRLGFNEAAYASYKEAKASGIEISPVAWVYLNTNTTPLNNVYDIEGQIDDSSFFESPRVGPEPWSGEDENGMTWWYPNGMSTSHDCFIKDMYKRSAYGLVRDGEPLQIGIKGALGSGQWAIWDDFQLVYRGMDGDVIKPILEEAIAGLDTSRPMGKSIYAKVSEVVASAQAAISSGNGNAMFEALSEVFALTEEISASVAKFAQLNAAVEDLQSITVESSNPVAINEANALCESLMNRMANHDIEEEEIDELMAQIQAAKTKLRMPDVTGASDANPIDMTAVIENPNYDENANGWSGTNAAYNGTGCNAEIYNAESFDYYQEFQGMPTGIYELTVQGFYRAGSATADYETVNDPSFSHAFLYAVGNGATYSAALTRLGAEAQLGDPYEGYVEVSEGSGMIVPNSMAAGGECFDMDLYLNNKVIAKVGEDGYLRIGLKKDTHIDMDWTLFDRWELKYLGAESSLAPSADPSGIENVNMANSRVVEYFTIDGRKASSLKKGVMIQKQTMPNGEIVIKKVRK